MIHFETFQIENRETSNTHVETSKMLLLVKNFHFRRFNWFASSTFVQDIMELLEKEKTAVAESKKKAEPYESRYDGRKKKRMWQGGADRNQEVANGEPDAKQERTEPFERIKRKKCAVLLGYCGKNYYGMQRNPGMKTIEEEILSAMKKNQWISEDGYNAPQQAGFQRAARTDKGVSAARQCVSVKIPNEVDVAAMNNDLPDDIRIFAVKRVTKGFNSKDQCDARTYTYTLPTFALTQHDQLADMTTYDGFRVDPERLEKTNSILKLYEGTHCFHNFTAKKGFNDPSAKRVILSFVCGEPFLIKEVEFVTLKVKGQSFMLHQIRKMVGLALAIIRGFADESALSKATTKIIMDIPTAPGLGLMLDQVHYDRYNKRYSSDGMHDALEWDKEAEEIQAFVRNNILPSILETEITDRPMLEWLNNLTRHTYEERKPEDAKIVESDDEEASPERKTEASEKASEETNEAVAPPEASASSLNVV